MKVQPGLSQGSRLTISVGGPADGDVGAAHRLLRRRDGDHRDAELGRPFPGERPARLRPPGGAADSSSKSNIEDRHWREVTPIVPTPTSPSTFESGLAIHLQARQAAAVAADRVCPVFIDDRQRHGCARIAEQDVARRLQRADRRTRRVLVIGVHPDARDRDLVEQRALDVPVVVEGIVVQPEARRARPDDRALGVHPVDVLADRHRLRSAQERQRVLVGQEDQSFGLHDSASDNVGCRHLRAAPRPAAARRRASRRGSRWPRSPSPARGGRARGRRPRSPRGRAGRKTPGAARGSHRNGCRR